MDGPLRYQVPAALVLAGLELVAVYHLAYGAVGDLQDPGGLAGGVDVVSLHGE